MGTGRGRRTGRGRIALAIVAAASMLTACAGGDAPPPTVGGEDPEQGEEQEQEEESEFAEDDAGEEPVSEDEILIGIVDGLSGSVSGFVEDKIRGAELAVEQANEDGGVLGRQIRTALRDDELEPGTAVQQVQALYQQAGAHVVMGSISSAVLLAVNEWIANNDRHYLAWDARTSAATEEEGNDGLVRTLSNTSMDAVAMATFFADQDYERWAMIAPNYEYGQALTSQFEQELSDRKDGVEFVTTQLPALGEVDFNPFITAILAEQPDAVYVGLFGGDAITFIRQANALGLFEEVTPVFLHGAGSLMDPVGMEMPLDAWVGTNYHWSIDNPENEAFVADFEEAYGYKPRDYNALGYLATQFLLAAIEEANSDDEAEIFDALRGMEMDTPAGTISIREFDGQSDMGMHIGRTVEDPELEDELGLEIVDYIPGEENRRSEEEIEELRAG
jgi:branched-chain amino acid transport system substrate-binding protein